eukprot:m.8058 g.8058  ORF g.8058 m.8058 type:complete len:420 (-) comp5160_c0_seq1:116-1375(-)
MGRILWAFALVVGLTSVFLGYRVNERGGRLLSLRTAFDNQPLSPNHAEALAALTNDVAAKWKVSFGLIDARRGFPVVLSPAKPTDGESPSFPIETLSTLLAEEAELIQNLIFKFGAVLLRGFPIKTPQEFEHIAGLIEPNLDDKYLGTSPRLLVPNTSHVFSASEFPGPVVIPVHCEMSFTHAPPPTIIFYAFRAPDSGKGGETPLSDFQAVWGDLPNSVRSVFESNDVLNVRSYFSEENLNINPLMTKSWQMMFETKNRTEALAAATANGFNASFNWHGSIVLENHSPSFRTHPRSGQPVWHNHLQVFYPDSIAAEYSITAVRTNSLFAGLMCVLADLMVAVNTFFHGLESIGQYAMLGNRSHVPQEVMDVVRATMWKHTVLYPYQTGDVVAIDNMRVAHGRQLYSGPRTVYVTWGGK